MRAGAGSPHDPRVERLWAVDDLAAVFAGDLAAVPWPRAPKGWLVRSGLRERVAQVADEPARLVEVDPRGLWANQPSVVAAHAAHYRTGEWERTARTSADRDQRANRFPIVVDDGAGRRVIVAGHHRALVALVEGRPLLTRLVPADAGDTPTVAVTPLLRLAADGASVVDPAAAVAEVIAGRVAHVADLAAADVVLAALGLDDTELVDLLAHAAGREVAR